MNYVEPCCKGMRESSIAFSYDGNPILSDNEYYTEEPINYCPFCGKKLR